MRSRGRSGPRDEDRAPALAVHDSRPNSASTHILTAGVCDAVSAVEGETFDIVYASFGALNWLPDIGRWASVVVELLAPAGCLYLAEFHPSSFVLDDATGSRVTHDYFDEGPEASGGPGTYADEAAMTEHNETIEWRHTLSTVVSAIAEAGLRIQFLHEHDHTFYLQRQSLERHDGDSYRHPEGDARGALTYSSHSIQREIGYAFRESG